MTVTQENLEKQTRPAPKAGRCSDSTAILKCIEELHQIVADINRVANRLAAEDGEPVTLETVRAALVERSQNGYTAQVRALLKKYGALKLTDVDPKYYADILAEAEGIDNAG